MTQLCKNQTLAVAHFDEIDLIETLSPAEFYTTDETAP